MIITIRRIIRLRRMTHPCLTPLFTSFSIQVVISCLDAKSHFLINKAGRVPDQCSVELVMRLAPGLPLPDGNVRRSLSLSLSLYLSVCGCVCVYTTWSPSVVFLFYYNLLVHANEPPHICQRASSYMQRSLLIYANEPPHVRQRASAPICLLQDQAFPGFVQSFLKDMFPKSNGCRKH